jgi:uncharacterized protein (DUF58 family)
LAVVVLILAISLGTLGVILIAALLVLCCGGMLFALKSKEAEKKANWHEHLAKALRDEER